MQIRWRRTNAVPCGTLLLRFLLESAADEVPRFGFLSRVLLSPPEILQRLELSVHTVVSTFINDPNTEYDTTPRFRIVSGL
jgi:hypothetical protein